MIPLILKIKKETHKSLARAHDIIIKEMYTVFDNAVFHGGTAIWRCYQGNRFSEDIDVYIEKNISKIESLFSNLEKKGFTLEKKKISENSLYSTLRFERTTVRFEAIFKKEKGMLKEYETVDGNILFVYTLPPDEFIKEKIEAYLSRLKIRDLYDIFFMLTHSQKKEGIKDAIKKLLKNYKNPVDEKDLKVLILEGLTPTSEKMIEYIKNIKWEDKNT